MALNFILSHTGCKKDLHSNGVILLSDLADSELWPPALAQNCLRYRENTKPKKKQANNDTNAAWQGRKRRGEAFRKGRKADDVVLLLWCCCGVVVMLW